MAHSITRRSLIFLAMATCALQARTAVAIDTYQWLNSSPNWNDPNAWVNQTTGHPGVPGSSDIALFPNGGFALVGSASVGEFVLQAGSFSGFGMLNVLNTNFFLIGAGGTASFSDAGPVTANGTLIGLDGGNGSMTFGPGMSLTDTSTISVGYNSQGSMLINGGSVSSPFFTIAGLAGGVGTVTVTGAGSTLQMGPQSQIGDVGNGQLIINSGGLANYSDATGGLGIATHSGSMGGVGVDGSGSKLTSAGGISVGSFSTGSLSVTNSGLVSATTFVNIGDATSGTGTATVDGSGSTVSSDDIGVGVFDTSNGTLTLSNGGKATATATITVGRDSGSIGQVTVGVSNATLSAGQQLVVGGSGKGTLTVNSAGIVTTSTNLYVGQAGNATNSGTVNINANGSVTAAQLIDLGKNANAVGSVTVTGQGASLKTTSGNLQVGDSGIGTLNISSSGQVTASGNLTIGVNAGANGQVTVGGTNATLTAHQQMVIGGGGKGTLTVNDSSVISTVPNIYVGQSNNDPSQGGTLSINGNGSVTASQLISVGTNQGAYGLIAVNSENSTLHSQADIRVGESGHGTLNITGGTVTADNLLAVGTSSASGAIGSVTVNGSNGNAKLVATAALHVGDSGQGTVALSSGGTMTSGISLLGMGVVGSNGSVSVDGEGSKWTVTDALTVGDKGTGSLTVSNDGKVDAQHGITLGAQAGSNGTLTFDDVSSNNVDTHGSDIVIGAAGHGTLKLLNGSSYSPSVVNFTLGDSAGSQGSIAVDGHGDNAASLFNYINTAILGHDGKGDLTITAGGQATMNSLHLATGAQGSTGSISVSGRSSSQAQTPSLLDAGNILQDSGSGSATISVSDGGSIHSSGEIYLKPDGQATSSLTVDGGTLTLSDGEIQTRGSQNNVTVNIKNGGQVTNSATRAVRTDLTIDGHASLQYSSLTSTGATQIANGTLTITNGGILNASDLQVGTPNISDANPNGPLTTAKFDTGGKGQVGSLEIGTGMSADFTATGSGTQLNVGSGGITAGNDGVTCIFSIGNGAQVNVSGGAVSIGALGVGGRFTVSDGAQLNVSGPNASLEIEPGTGGLSKVNLNGNVSVQGDFSVQNDFGDATNSVSIFGDVSVAGGLSVFGMPLSIDGTVTANHVFIDNGFGRSVLLYNSLSANTVTIANGLLTCLNPENGAHAFGHLAVQSLLSVGGQIDLAGTGSVDVGSLLLGSPAPQGWVYVHPGGTLSGKSRIVGNVKEVGGKVHPGGSPGTLTIDGDFEADASSQLIATVQGTTAGDAYSQLVVTGNATFAGSVALDFENGFAPKTGDIFDLISAGGAVNQSVTQFNVSGLMPGWQYQTSVNNGSFELVSLNDAVAVLPGDFNLDGHVDAADYVGWRKGLGTTYTEDDFGVWRDNFEQPAGNSAGANNLVSVPEPAGGTLITIGLLFLASVTVRAKSSNLPLPRSRCKSYLSK